MVLLGNEDARRRGVLGLGVVDRVTVTGSGGVWLISVHGVRAVEAMTSVLVGVVIAAVRLRTTGRGHGAVAASGDGGTNAIGKLGEAVGIAGGLSRVEAVAGSDLLVGDGVGDSEAAETVKDGPVDTLIGRGARSRHDG